MKKIIGLCLMTLSFSCFSDGKTKPDSAPALATSDSINSPVVAAIPSSSDNRLANNSCQTEHKKIEILQKIKDRLEKENSDLKQQLAKAKKK